MPIDDTCARCGEGTIRLVKLPERPERERLKREVYRFVLLRRYCLRNENH